MSFGFSAVYRSSALTASLVWCFCSSAVASARQSAALFGFFATLLWRPEIEGPLPPLELKKFDSALEMPVEPEPTPSSANVAANATASPT